MSHTENVIIATNNLAKALGLAKIDKSIDLKTMNAIQKIIDIFQHDIVKTNEDATPLTVNKKQQKVFSSTLTPRVPGKILDHTIKKPSYVIPYGDNEIDTKTHNH